jgi:hypothetical protein
MIVSWKKLTSLCTELCAQFRREEVVYQIFNHVKHSQLTSFGILYRRAEFWATVEKRKEVWCVALLKI